MPQKGTGLRGRIVAAVMELGECTSAQVVARVGRTISASAAISTGHKIVATQRKNWDRYAREVPTAKLAELGRNEMVRSNLQRAVQCGYIRRVSRGVYGPPQPRIYQPGKAS